MPPASGTITVPDTTHGSTVTASTSDALVEGENVYVFVQCYKPDGSYVYAAYFPVADDGTAELGPLSSSLWTDGPASGQAEAGWFTRGGFGKWRATTDVAEFAVDA